MSQSANVSEISHTPYDKASKRFKELEYISVDLGYNLPENILKLANEMGKNQEERNNLHRKTKSVELWSHEIPEELEKTVEEIKIYKEKMASKLQKRLEEFKVANTRHSSSIKKSINSELLFMQKSAAASLNKNSKAIEELLELQKIFEKSRFLYSFSPEEKRYMKYPYTEQHIIEEIENIRENIQMLERNILIPEERKNKMLIEDLKSELLIKMQSEESSNSSCARCSVF